MNDMRKLINLMEGVTAVPGINPIINELSKDTLRSYSRERGKTIHADQRDAMDAHQNSADASAYGDTNKAAKWDSEASWLHNRAEKGAAGVARATTKIAAKESAPPGMEDVVLDLKKQYPGDHSKAFATAWSIYNKKHGKAEEGCSAMEGMDDSESSIHPVNIIKSVISQLHPNDTSAAAVANEVPALANDPQYQQWHKQAEDMFYGATGSDIDDEDSFTDYTMRQGEMGNPDRAMEEAHVDSCRQTNPATARDACAMNENSDYDLDFISQSIRSNYDIAASEEELKQMVAGETGYGQNPDFDNMFHSSLDHFLNGDDTSFDHLGGPDDFSDDAEALASAGHGSDEDYGYADEVDEARSSDINPDEVKALSSMQVDAAKARAQEIIAASTTGDNKKRYLANQINRARTTVDIVGLLYNMILAGEGNAVQGSGYSRKFNNAMEEDINNGYDDINNANGNDFFPNGADSPVVKAVGPSGARQGDNPEQKKMQVAEVHKELVYGYRKFLKESAQATQKQKLTESTQVSNIEVMELHENPYADSGNDSITYNDSISMSATAINKNGEPTEIGYSVDVSAVADINWESDESPTGWNYKLDIPTYTSYEYATSGDISVTSVEFTNGAEFYVNNDAMELREFYQYFDPTVLKQLLNPEIYVNALGSSFDKAVENLEPPEPEFDEPERDYGDNRY